MKLFDPPKTLLQLKKRAQLYLLTLNVILATVNFIKLDQPQPNLICEPYPSFLICRPQ